MEMVLNADSYLNVHLLDSKCYGQLVDKLESLYTKTDKTPLDYINLHALQIQLSYNSIENRLFELEMKKMLEQDDVIDPVRFSIDMTAIKVKKLTHRFMGEEYVHAKSMHDDSSYVIRYVEFIEKLTGTKYRILLDTKNQKDFTDKEKFLEFLSTLL